MKLKCKSRDLSEGIKIVQKAISPKSSIPILQGILFDASGIDIKLTGNDLEIGIEYIVDADIEEKGSIVIDSRILGEIVDKLPEEFVFIDIDDESQVVVIESGYSRFEIKGLPASGYPAIPDVKKDEAFSINQDVLRDMIWKTVFAVSLDENRPVLTGSLFECLNGEMTVVSCDSFRVALRRQKVDGANNDMNVIIPGKTLNKIKTILQTSESPVKIYHTENQILFEVSDNCRLVSRLIEGEYFKYRSFVPEEYDTKMTVNAKRLLTCIESASVVINTDERRYPVRFNIAGEMMVITANTEVGTVREEIKVDVIGNDLEIGFNPRYFVEALREISDEDTEICFSSGIAVLKPVDSDSFIYLIVPLRK